MWLLLNGRKGSNIYLRYLNVEYQSRSPAFTHRHDSSIPPSSTKCPAPASQFSLPGTIRETNRPLKLKTVKSSQTTKTRGQDHDLPSTPYPDMFGEFKTPRKCLSLPHILSLHLYLNDEGLEGPWLAPSTPDVVVLCTSPGAVHFQDSQRIQGHRQCLSRHEEAYPGTTWVSFKLCQTLLVAHFSCHTRSALSRSCCSVLW
jgi:hypothetical protein